MRLIAFIVLLCLAPLHSLHANSTSNALFMGCVQSSANCVSGRAALVGPSGIPNYQTWEYSFTTTFDPPGGWVFTYEFLGKIAGEPFAFSADPFNDMYGSGDTLGSPNSASVFTGFLTMPVGWSPEQLAVFTYEPGRDPPGSPEAGFQTTELLMSAQTTVPEPGTMALVAGGLAGLALRRRRRRTAQ